MTDTASRAPLEGVRVLDFSRYAPGLFASRLLSELGADVVGIEAIPAGSASELPGYGLGTARIAGVHPLYAGRRSVAIDARQPAGRELLTRMATTTDVLIEGFRPGVMDRLGLGRPELESINPRLVMCSLTGYGQDGTLAQKAGHDLNYLAEAGALAFSVRDGVAGIPLNLIADIAAGGLGSAYNVLAALLRRERTGRGAYLDVSMTRSVLSFVAPAAAGLQAAGVDPSWGRGLLSGRAPFYDCYQTSDHRWVCVAAIEPPFFRNLCSSLKLLYEASDQFEESRWDALRADLATAFGSRPRRHWEETFAAVDAAVSPVLSVGEAVQRARDDGLLAGLPAPTLTAPELVVDTFGRMARTPGQDTANVLTESGLSAEEIDRLVADGVLGRTDTDDTDDEFPQRDSHRRA